MQNSNENPVEAITRSLPPNSPSIPMYRTPYLTYLPSKTYFRDNSSRFSPEPLTFENGNYTRRLVTIPSGSKKKRRLSQNEHDQAQQKRLRKEKYSLSDWDITLPSNWTTRRPAPSPYRRTFALAGYEGDWDEKDGVDENNMKYMKGGLRGNSKNFLRSNKVLNTLLTSHSDAHNILQVVLWNKTEYRKLLRLEGKNAQSVLDVMQMLLDSKLIIADPFESEFRSVLLKAIQRLSKRSILYPKSLVLTDIKREEYPVTSGHFGEIYKGYYNERNVALKVFKLYSSQMSKIPDLLKKFISEAILWRHLKNRNVLPFYGIYHLGDSGGRICLISPWMDNGNMTEYLEKNPDVNRKHLTSDIAGGLLYLHKQSVIHGDLKGANVLISKNGVACLADFGLSSIVCSQSLAWTSVETTVSTAGTIRWQAPELLDENSIGVTKESDMYAFACVCYEIFVGKVPFYQYVLDPAVMRQIMLGQRPLRPALDSAPYAHWGLTGWIWTLIEECWREDPTTRLKASEVVDKISSRIEFLRRDAGGQDSWGELRPEVFKSLVDQQSQVSEADIQRFISLLKSM